MQQNGDFVLCDRFKIFDILLKFTQTFTKEMTKVVNNIFFFFVNIRTKFEVSSLLILDIEYIYASLLTI